MNQVAIYQEPEIKKKIMVNHQSSGMKKLEKYD